MLLKIHSSRNNSRMLVSRGLMTLTGLARISQLWLICSIFSFRSCAPMENTNQIGLQDIITSTKHLIEYYAANYHQMNLDGIYGLRLLEGQMQRVLEDEDVVADISPATLHTLRQMHFQASQAANQSMKYIERDDPEYFAQLKPLIDRPTLVQKEYRRVDLTLEWPPGTASLGGEFSEKFSDKCMRQLMGDGVHEDTKCLLSPQCLQVMTTKGMLEYHITHQLLYTILAEQCECVEHIESYLDEQGLGADMEFLQLEFCSNNFLEMAQSVQQLGGTIVPMYQDLFLEQEFVCAELGFMEFLHVDWLKQILSWQKPNGCFGKMQKVNLPPPVSKGKHVENPAHELYHGKLKDADVKAPGNANNVVVQKNVHGHNSLVLQGQNQSIYNKIKFLPSGKETSKLIQNQPREQRGKFGVDDLLLKGRGSEKGQVVFPALDSKQQALPHEPLVNMMQHQGEQQRLQPHVFGEQRLAGELNRHAIKYPARRLLVEKELDDGCLSHKTAVAAGALSQFLRFGLNPGTFEYSREVSLYGTNYMMIPYDKIRESAAASQGRGQKVHAFEPVDRDVIFNNGMNLDPHDKAKQAGLDYEKSELSQEDPDYYNYDEHKGDDDYDDEDNDDDGDGLFQPLRSHDVDELREELPDDDDEEEQQGDRIVQDEEYEQYLDEDKDRLDVKQKVLNKAAFSAVLQPKHHVVNNEQETDNGDQDEYSYYDKDGEQNINIDDKVDAKEGVALALSKKDQNQTAVKKDKATSSVGYTYMFILIAMLVILYMMFRFVRKKKKVPTATLR